MLVQSHLTTVAEIQACQRQIAELTSENQRLAARIGELEQQYGVGMPSVTSRNQEQEAVAGMGERMQFLLSVTPGVVYSSSTTPPFARTFVAESVTQLGYEPSQFTANPDFWLNRIHPDDVPRVLAELPRLFEREEHVDEYRFQKSDGSYVWMRDEMRLVRNKNGEVIEEIIGCWTVVTERKHAVDLLLERERAYATLLRNLAGVVYRCKNDSDWTATYVSDGCVALTGYTSEDLIGNRVASLGALIHPEDADWVWEKCQASLANRKSCNNEYRIRTATGEEKWVWDQAQGVYNESGEMVFIEGYLADISERKRAEEKLRDSERKYRRLIETAQEGVWVIDTVGRTTFVNSQMAVMLGYTPDEMLGRSLFDFMDAEAREEARQNLERRRQGIREQHDFRLQHRDGSDLWTSISTNPLFDDDGNFSGALAMVSDISDRKSMEADLKRSRDELETRVADRTAELTLANSNLATEISERLRLDEERERLFSIIDQTTDLIGWARPDGRIQYLNRAARALAGMPDVAEVSQLAIWQLHPHWARELVEREVIPALHRWGVWQGELALLQHDGTEIPVWEAIHVHRSISGEIELISTIAHDISARKQADESLHQLAHLNRLGLLGEMASTMAHELNQPLGTIANNARALMRGVDSSRPLPPETVEVLKDIAADAMRAGEILRSVARFAAKRPSEVTLIDINEMVQDAVRIVAADARRYSTRLQVDLADDTPLFYGGKVQIQQVLVNLIRNALEAGSELDARDRVVVITTQFDNDFITISVADSGSGLPEESLATIFEPYFTTKPDGLGMGLNISRSIVMSCGGKLWAQRNPDRGMTFYFTVPTAGGDGAHD